MRRLAAGRRAGVEHAGAGGRSQQLGRALRAGVLHRNEPVEETGQGIDRHRLLEQQTAATDRARRESGGREPVEIVGDGAAALIDAQRHRRRLVAGGGDRLPVVAIRPAQARQPPARMLEDSLFVLGHRRQEFIAPAQEVAQHAVDHPFEHAARQFAGGDHRLIDDGVRRLGTRIEAIQRGQQQGLRFAVRERFGHQTAKDEFAPTVTAQHAVGNILRRRARRWRLRSEDAERLAQALAGMDGRQYARRQQQAPAQRIRGQRRTRRRRGGNGRTILPDNAQATRRRGR